MPKKDYALFDPMCEGMEDNSTIMILTFVFTIKITFHFRKWMVMNLSYPNIPKY